MACPAPSPCTGHPPMSFDPPLTRLHVACPFAGPAGLSFLEHLLHSYLLVLACVVGMREGDNTSKVYKQDVLVHSTQHMHQSLANMIRNCLEHVAPSCLDCTFRYIYYMYICHECIYQYFNISILKFQYINISNFNISISCVENIDMHLR